MRLRILALFCYIRTIMAKLVAQNHPALHDISEEITPGEFSDGTVAKILKNMRQAIKEYAVDGFSAVAIAAPPKNNDVPPAPNLDATFRVRPESLA